MQVINKVNKLIKRLKKDGCKVTSTQLDRQAMQIVIRMIDYRGQIVETKYSIQDLNI